MSISVTGDKEIAKKLALLGNSMPAVMEEAIMAGAPVLKDGMKHRLRKRTGRTAEDVSVHDAKVTPSGFSVKVGPIKRAFIARFLEYGTSKMAAKPWLRPTLDEDAARVLKEVNAEIDAAIGRVMGP